MSDRELLELVVSNQMYLHFRRSQIESHVSDTGNKSGADITKDALDKSISFFDRINEELIKLTNE